MTLDAHFSNFGCAGTVVMPGQGGVSTPPTSCVSADTGDRTDDFDDVNDNIHDYRTEPARTDDDPARARRLAPSTTTSSSTPSGPTTSTTVTTTTRRRRTSPQRYDQLTTPSTGGRGEPRHG